MMDQGFGSSMSLETYLVSPVGALFTVARHTCSMADRSEYTRPCAARCVICELEGADTVD